MAPQPIERHRLSGMDDRARGFNREVQIIAIESGYQANLQYEATRVVTLACPSPVAAMQSLISHLHARGYTQLRSQLNFRERQYLGSQEPFVEYPDPARGLLSRLRTWLGLGSRPSSGTAT